MSRWTDLKAALRELFHPIRDDEDRPDLAADTAARTAWVQANRHPPETVCQGADFSRVAYVLGQGLKDHADRDGLTGVARAVFMDRGGHASGEGCPTAPPDNPHRYWCQFPDDECGCGVTP